MQDVEPPQSLDKSTLSANRKITLKNRLDIDDVGVLRGVSRGRQNGMHRYDTDAAGPAWTVPMPRSLLWLSRSPR